MAQAALNLAIIGGGNMGTAYAHALLSRKLVSSKRMLIVERSAQKRRELSARFKCQVLAEIPASVSTFSFVLFAVKPQDRAEVVATLAPKLSPKQVVISILAGVPIAKLSKELGGHKRIIRCMPNTPAQIGLGMSAFACSAEVPPAAVRQAQALFDATGASLELPSERFLDPATAISGSGPAYVFYFIEYFLKAAREMGFSERESELLVAQTVLGALSLWTSSGESPAMLRQKVTSKRGVTEAGVKVLDQKHFGDALVACTRSVRRKCVALAREGSPRQARNRRNFRRQK